MIGFGPMMGVIFPFFVTFVGVPSRFVMTPWFVTACIWAGIFVGVFNFVPARLVIGRCLRLLSERLRFVESNLREVAQCGDPERCAPEDCFVPVDSDDEIGESAQAFNQLVEALTFAHQTEAAVRDFNKVPASQLILETLSGDALARLVEHTGATAGAILIEADGEPRVSVAYVIRSPEELPDNDHVRHALRTEKRQKVVMPDDVVIQGVLTDFGPRETRVDPLIYKGIPLGPIIPASST